MNGMPIDKKHIPFQMLAYRQVICCMFAHIQSSFAKCHDCASSPQAGFIIYNLHSKYHHGGQILSIMGEKSLSTSNQHVEWSSLFVTMLLISTIPLGPSKSFLAIVWKCHITKNGHNYLEPWEWGWRRCHSRRAPQSRPRAHLGRFPLCGSPSSLMWSSQSHSWTGPTLSRCPGNCQSNDDQCVCLLVFYWAKPKRRMLFVVSKKLNKTISGIWFEKKIWTEKLVPSHPLWLKEVLVPKLNGIVIHTCRGWGMGRTKLGRIKILSIYHFTL